MESTMNAVLSFIQKLRRFSPLLLALFTGACSTNGIRTPQNRFESPEIAGETTVHVGLYSSGHIDFTPNLGSPANPTIVDDDPEFPDQPQNPDFWDNLSWMGGTISSALQSMGLEGRANPTDHLELYFNSRYETMGIRAKYQFLGEPASRAKAGNLSLALDAGFGKTDITQSLTHRYAYNLLDTALIAGYRLDDTILLYGGPYFSRYLTSSDAPEAVDVLQQGANLGLRFQFRRHASLAMEIARSRMEGGATGYLQTHYGLQLRFTNR
jgi:hypothetical protein